MAFNYVGSRNGATRNLVKTIIADSATVAVGEVVTCYADGAATNGAAAAPIYGIIHGFVKGNGRPGVHADVVAGTALSSDTSSVTASASNEADKTDYALVDTSRGSLYSAEVNGTLSTTVASDTPNCRIDVDSNGSDYGRVLETTATRTVGTPANFYSWGKDPDDSTRLIVSIALSELDSVDE